jgi:hypothetical protein
VVYLWFDRLAQRFERFGFSKVSDEPEVSLQT